MNVYYIAGVCSGLVLASVFVVLLDLTYWRWMYERCKEQMESEAVELTATEDDLEGLYGLLHRVTSGAELTAADEDFCQRVALDTPERVKEEGRWVYFASPSGGVIAEPPAGAAGPAGEKDADDDAT